MDIILKEMGNVPLSIHYVLLTILKTEDVWVVTQDLNLGQDFALLQLENQKIQTVLPLIMNFVSHVPKDSFLMTKEHAF